MTLCSWLQWQIDYLLILQNFRDLSNHIFDNFFLFITTFGETFIPIMLITLIYWCVNKKLGQFLLWNYAIGFVINTFLKITACIYRPWILSCNVHPLPQAIPGAGGYSFPSGHTTGAVAVWGGLAYWCKNNKWIVSVALTIMLLIMFSRNYLGVHTPQDVVVSFIIGCCLLFGIDKIIKYIDDNKNADLVVVSVVTASIAILLPYLFLKSYPCDYVNGKILYDTFGMKLFSSAKSFCVLGLFWGWLIEKRYIKFSAETGSLINKILRYIIGILVLCLLLQFDKYLGRFGNIFINNMILYFIIGLYITLIHPYLFSKFVK